MSTIASVRVGTKTYRCDAKCYNAKAARCTCGVCFGANHGRGLEAAHEQSTAAAVKTWAKRQHASAAKRGAVTVSPFQIALFPAPAR